MDKQRVLILCTGNSCRSQIAEGLWRARGGARWDVYSAGLAPKGVNPLAVRVMDELNIDIRSHTSDNLTDYVDQPFDLVVTVCGNADQNCPVFPGAAEKLHWPFDDPADAPGDDEARLPTFRRVRDEIAARIGSYLEASGGGATGAGAR